MYSSTVLREVTKKAFTKKYIMLGQPMQYVFFAQRMRWLPRITHADPTCSYTSPSGGSTATQSTLIDQLISNALGNITLSAEAVEIVRHLLPSLESLVFSLCKISLTALNHNIPWPGSFNYGTRSHLRRAAVFKSEPHE